jgi:hypothetical protein
LDYDHGYRWRLRARCNWHHRRAAEQREDKREPAVIREPDEDE